MASRPSRPIHVVDGATGANTAPIEITFPQISQEVVIANEDATNNLEFQMMGGTKWFPVFPRTVLKLDAHVVRMWVRSPGGGAINYAIMILI